MKKSCVILGPTKIEKIKIYGKIDDIDDYVRKVSEFLAKNFEQVIIIPDNTLPLKIAKVIKSMNPKTVIIGYVPAINAGGEALNEFHGYCDEIISTGGSWFNLNTSLTKNSDIIFCFGFSAGVFIELCSIKYNQMYLKLKTHVYIDERTISLRLPEEVAVDLKNLHYFDNFKDLKNEFKS